MYSDVLIPRYWGVGNSFRGRTTVPRLPFVPESLPQGNIVAALRCRHRGRFRMSSPDWRSRIARQRALGTSTPPHRIATATAGTYKFDDTHYAVTRCYLIKLVEGDPRRATRAATWPVAVDGFLAAGWSTTTVPAGAANTGPSAGRK